ncbi:MAG: hypothetical protein AAB614_00700 [Patescibacteria group bacterium]
MKEKQKLENYITKYKDESLWEVFETKHYVFHYPKDSIAEREIVHISITQEQAYTHIMSILKIKENPLKIQYYIYSSEKDKDVLMGDDGFAQALWDDYSIHIIYTEDIKPIGAHEDTHLLTLPWGVAIGFFQEGLAEYMRGCTWGKDKKSGEYFVQEGMAKNVIPSLESFLSHIFWTENSGEKAEYYYPLAGVFTRFLIEKFGLDKYRDFYQKIHRDNSLEENKKIFEGIIGDFNEVKKGCLQTISE